MYESILWIKPHKTSKSLCVNLSNLLNHIKPCKACVWTYLIFWGTWNLAKPVCEPLNCIEPRNRSESLSFASSHIKVGRVRDSNCRTLKLNYPALHQSGVKSQVPIKRFSVISLDIVYECDSRAENIRLCGVFAILSIWISDSEWIISPNIGID